MDGGHGLAYRIRDQNRQTICSLHPERDVFNARDNRIPFCLVPLRGDILYDMHAIGMHLV